MKKKNAHHGLDIIKYGKELLKGEVPYCEDVSRFFHEVEFMEPFYLEYISCPYWEVTLLIICSDMARPLHLEH